MEVQRGRGCVFLHTVRAWASVHYPRATGENFRLGVVCGLVHGVVRNIYIYIERASSVLPRVLRSWSFSPRAVRKVDIEETRTYVRMYVRRCCVLALPRP